MTGPVSFPNEVFEQIFQHLSPIELSRIARTGHRLRQIVQTSSLWERAYFAFWREEDHRKSDVRGTKGWRESRRVAALRERAQVAWQRQQDHPSNKAEASGAARQGYPFPFYISSSSSKPAENTNGTSPYHPHFFALFVERIAIDQAILDELRDQCHGYAGWIERIERLVSTYGGDMKDILHALVSVQQRTDAQDESKSALRSPKMSVEDDFPSAFELRLPYAKRSSSYHLTLLHLGRELLEHLQCREAMRGLLSMRPDSEIYAMSSPWSSLRPLHPDIPTERIAAAQIVKQFENGLCWLSMFRGGEGQEVSEELDCLAVACSLFVARRFPTYNEDSIEFAKGICEFMSSRGFRGASDADFHNLDNNFIHLCIDESGRESLPLTLVVIFCSLAARLGLCAFPTNTPMKLMVVVDDSIGRFGEEERHPRDRFWVNVYNDGQIFRRGDMMGLFGARISFSDDAIMAQSSPSACCLRAARNIITSVQRAQVLPTFNTAPLGKLMEDLEGIEKDDAASRSAREARLSPDEWFERKTIMPSNLFNPRRTFLHTSTRNIHLVSPFWNDDVNVDALRRAPASGISIGKGPFLASVGRFQRVTHWPEATQHAAMHAASNALTRLGDELGERGVEWSMGLIRTFFPLDILVMHDELTGNVHTSDEEDNSPQVQTPLYIRNDARRQSVTQTFNALLADDRQGPTPKRRTYPVERDGEIVQRPIDNAPSGDPVFPVGMVFMHRVYHYRAVIVGWDERCEAEEDWIVNMGVDDLPNGGRRQPFYHSMVDDGSTRYVAHCNIRSTRLASVEEERQIAAGGALRAAMDATVVTSDELERLMRIRGVGRLFRCASLVGEGALENVRLLRNGQGDRAFPDDE